MEILQLIAPILTAMRGIIYLQKVGFFRVANIVEQLDSHLSIDLLS